MNPQALNEQLTSSNLIPQVLDGLKSIGELGSKLGDASSAIADMKSKMLAMESSLKQLRRETKRAKKEEAAMRSSLESLQRVVDAVQGAPVYFDASRYMYCRTSYPNRPDQKIFSGSGQVYLILEMELD